ncbi:hypothetical protein H0X48_05490 [Candidatus Dependentiae bacterium]|nr:hypothetical protein [Candidatus Dependentiae bacterium]
MSNITKIIHGNATTYSFQLIMLCITSLLLGITIYHSTKNFNSLDQMPELFPITPAHLEEFQGTPTTVEVGLYIKDFPEFNVLKNEFVFSGIIWFQFDPSKTSLDTLGKFSIEKGEIVSLSAPTTRLIEGKVFARYDIRVRFKAAMNFSLFPLEDHTIYIILDNHFVTPGEIRYESSVSSFILSPNMIVSDWIPYDRSVYTGHSESHLEEGSKDKNVYYPRVVFGIDYKRSGTRQLFTILLPLILIFFITVFSLSMDPEAYSKSIIALSTGSVTALLAYRFVIENLSPHVGYFMLSDLLFFLFLGAVFIIFFVNALTLTLGGRSKAWITVLVHTLVVSTSLYLIDFWLR